MTPTPKAQAEAMAEAILNEVFDPNSPKGFVPVMATALEKLLAEQETSKKVTTSLWNEKNALLAENERLKKEAHSNDCPVVEERDAWMNRAEGMKLGNEILSKERDTLQSQLTATEARLSESKKWLAHRPNCEVFRWARGTWPCTCGLDAFLSTIAAEKKEQNG